MPDDEVPMTPEITKDMFEWIQYFVKSGLVEQMMEKIEKLEQKFDSRFDELVDFYNDKIRELGDEGQAVLGEIEKLEHELKRVEIIANAKAVVVPEGKGIFWTNKIASLREEIKNGDIMVLEPLMKDITELKEDLTLIMNAIVYNGKYNIKIKKKLSGEKSEDNLTPGTARASSTDSKLIAGFIQKLKEKDNKIDCKYRCADEPCEQCTNYHYCEDCSYIIIKEYQKKLQEEQNNDEM